MTPLPNDEPPAPLAVLLDDNLMFSSAVVPGLRAAGYRVHSLTSPAGLPEALRQEPAALLAVNLTSTRFPATEVIRSIRSAEGLRDLPIIGYAGHVEREFLAAGLAAGATLVVPNSAIRGALPQVLQKLARRLENAEAEDGGF